MKDSSSTRTACKGAPELKWSRRPVRYPTPRNHFPILFAKLTIISDGHKCNVIADTVEPRRFPRSVMSERSIPKALASAGSHVLIAYCEALPCGLEFKERSFHLEAT